MVSKNKHKVSKALQDALIFCQKGEFNKARVIYKKLIKVIPANDQMLANFGTLELQMGNIEYANELLDKSLLINPNQPNILNNLGNFYLDKGDFQKSINYYDKAIILSPRNFNNFYNKGRAMTSANKIDEAINCYQQAISIEPENKLAHFNLGFVFNLTKNFDKAIDQYDTAIKIDGNYSEAFFNRGVTYSNKLNHQRAINDFSAAIKIKFNERFIFKRAREYEEIGKFSEALDDYSLIINSESLIDNKSTAFCRRGDLQNQMNNHKKGMPDIEMAITLQPNNAAYYNNYANGLRTLNQNKEAVKFYKRAIELDYESYSAKLNLAYFEFAAHNFSNAWRLYESRWHAHDQKTIPLSTKKPMLNSFDVKNKKILIWSEQGLGDHILYSTMLADALMSANDFIVVIDLRLLDLYKASFKDFKNVVFLESADNENLYDFHIPMGDLGKFFRISKKDFVNQKKPLLLADKKYTRILKDKINSNKKFICGLSWRSKNPTIGKSKSIRLTDLKPIFNLPNIDFVDLQYGDTKKEKKEFKDNFGFELVEMSNIDKFNDITALAALINACDFVITTSNVTAHIAGALNKKTYLIAPYTDGRIWYWGIDEHKSLWYPSIQILRSDKVNDWEAPIKNLLDLLSQEINDE
jgi:tetratricopeptide (TPR) repeat protein